MKSLYELARIVTSRRLDNVAAFNVYNRHAESKYNRFLDGILKEEFKSDEEAALAIYDTQGAGVQYRVLKNRLKQRLYNNILFMDSGKRAGSAYFSSYYSLYRHLVVAKFLIGLAARNAGYELLRKVLAKAIKYQMSDIIQQCALHFRRDSMNRGDKKRFDYYNRLFIEANTNMLAEAKAEELYYSVMIHFNQSFTCPPELVSMAKKSMESISLLRQNHPTYQLQQFEYNIKSGYYQMVNDYRACLEASTQFENYLLSNPIFYTMSRHGNVLVNKLSCYLHLSEFKEGMKNAERAVKLYGEGTANWFLVLEIYFLLAINRNDLPKAADIYCKALEHYRFNDLRAQQAEVWKIYGGYLWFLLNYHNEEKCIQKLKEHRLTFRISKLINDIPLFAQDKKGMNVAVLILQVLLLLEKKDYVGIISRTEALKGYIYRNLSKDDALRSHYFIKMLLAMEKAQFDLKKTEQKTKALLEKLKQAGTNYTATQARMEIIPYERLWDMAMNLIR